MSFATLGSPWALHSPAKNFEYFIETYWATVNTATVTQRCKTDEINWNSYIIIWAHVLAYIEKVIWKKRYNNCSKKKLTTSTSVDINSKISNLTKTKYIIWLQKSKWEADLQGVMMFSFLTGEGNKRVPRCRAKWNIRWALPQRVNRFFIRFFQCCCCLPPFSDFMRSR